MTPVIVPVPSGHWGIGPSLLYMFGTFGVLLYYAWKDDHSYPDAKETRRREMERRKDEAFTRALKRGAAERRGLGL